MGKLRSQFAGLGLLGKSAVEASDPLADIRAVVAAFPGPAIVISKSGKIVDCNEAGLPLQREFLECRSEGGPALQEAIHKGRAEQVSVKLQMRTGEKITYDMAVTPLAIDLEDALFLLTGRDGSMQYNLIDALVASRQLFKDLITCTEELVWETDEEGRFRYTSPRGAFGYSAAELDGMLVEDLLMLGGPASEALQNPFFNPAPVRECEIWIRAKDGEAVCMIVNSIPVKSKEGLHLGNRGAAQDVTADIKQRQHMEFIAGQEMMVEKIVDAIRREVDADRLFEIAGSGASEALNSSRVIIQRLSVGNHLEAAFNQGVAAGSENFLRDWFWKSREQEHLENEVLSLTSPDDRLHVAPIYVKGRLAGVIALARRHEALDLSNDEKNLLKVLAGHLGVALIQVNAREQLVELSRTDELSGLLNRRAFHEDVVKRIEHGKRTQRPNAMFYIDLDNFKPVNDRFGHEKGDDVLKAVSGLLKSNSRVGDLVSRLGGDEFAMWLEDMDKAGAVQKAEELQAACREVSKTLDVIDPYLSFSIGITLSNGAEGDNLELLLSRADAAMYEVKRQGKGTFALAKGE
ncbi:MAG: diguanylate cyclase [Sneathiella sp.]|nr:diguanylate cyclase [Sneathiella sp.]